MIKAVILAAGKGTRLKPLTSKNPKPAIRLLEKNILEHNLTELSGLIEEAIIIVGYKSKIIKEKIGDSFAGIKIKYVTQKKQLGTGDAAKLALPFLEERFLILNGDDLYFKEDIKKCLEKNPSILLKKIKNPMGYGQICAKGKKVEKIVEKPKKVVSNLINVGCYYLNKSFFEKEINISPRGEYEITDFLKQHIEKENLYFVSAKKWIPITYPWSIFDGVKETLKNKKEKREGIVEKGAEIKGKVITEKGSIIKAGSKIIGPVYVGKDSVISKGAYIKGVTAIHDNCFIGEGVKIENSVLFSGTKILDRAIVGHSVVGENCSVGCDVVLKNSLSEKCIISSRVNGKKVSTKREKMGAVIGHRVKINSNSSVMPGIVIESASKICPNTKVKKNVEKSK
jgi:bifunctional UDP-N-acetylglucosamine pyrophosphorylase/glucosamine-1-phosphate N-acetyltransferase